MALILRWPLNETSGSTANEIVAGNNGTFYPGSSPKHSWELKDGYQSLKGDGSTAYYTCEIVNIGDVCNPCVLCPDQIAIDYPLSISFWFNSDVASGRPIIEVGNSEESGAGIAYTRRLNAFLLTTGKLAFDTWKDDGVLQRTETVATKYDGEWHLGIARVCVSGGAYSQYLTVDGTTVGGAISKPLLSINNYYWKIAGGRSINTTNPNVTNGVWNGWLTDIRVFDHCLSDSEMDDIYNAGPNPIETVTNAIMFSCNT